MSILAVNVSPEPQYESIRACRACLSTGDDLHDIQASGLAPMFTEFTSLPVKPSDGYPQYVCTICWHLIRKFFTFRAKCHSVMFTILQMSANKETVTMDKLNSIQTTHLKLNYMKSKTFTTSYLPVDKQDYDVEDDVANTDGNFIEDVDSKAKTEFTITFEEDDDDGRVNDDESNQLEDKNDVVDDKITNIELEIKIEKEESEADVPEENKSKTNKRSRGSKKRKPKKDIDIVNDISEVNSEKITKKRKYVKKDTTKARKEKMAESLVKTEADNDLDESFKNAKLFFDRHPSKKPTAEQLKKKMEMIENFSRNYNVDIKILSKEDQRKELEERKVQYKNLPYICDVCYRGYSLEGPYRSHMTVHDPASGDYPCDICGKRSKTRRSLEKHINDTHLRRFTCKQCGMVTTSQSYAKAHFARHRGATYTCDQCGKTFSHQTNYLGHMRSAHESRATICGVCGDALLGQLGLSVHMGIVHNQAMNCKSCNIVFHDPECLQKHLEGAVDNACPPDVKPCPMCGTNFPSEKLLMDHYDEEHKELKCGQCHKKFSTRLKYLTHMHGHKKEARRVTIGGGGKMCEVCGKGNFKNLTELRIHQRLHTGEKPYKCTLCPKSFRMTTFLKGHMRTHTDERPFKCQECHQTFKQNTHLQYHKQTHTSARPHSCSQCNKRFGLTVNLRAHVRSVHHGVKRHRKTRPVDNVTV